jgi:hypothetical protein
MQRKERWIASSLTLLAMTRLSQRAYRIAFAASTSRTLAVAVAITAR